MKWIVVLAGVLSLSATPVMAQSLLDEYVAYIGEDDLYNSRGTRLRQPWQIVRQDRANFHRFGVRDRGDEWDAFFESAGNRDLMEQMLASGDISRSAARAVLGGHVWIRVQVWGRGGRGSYVSVDVE